MEEEEEELKEFPEVFLNDNGLLVFEGRLIDPDVFFFSRR